MTISNWATAADVAAWLGKKRAAGMNKLETRYAEELERQRRAGVIDGWNFEGEKLRLALRCFYTPDFVVVLPSGRLEMHEVKPASRGKRNRQGGPGRPGFWAREDSILKLRWAAQRYPDYRFRVVWPSVNAMDGWYSWDVPREG